MTNQREKRKNKQEKRASRTKKGNMGYLFLNQ